MVEIYRGQNVGSMRGNREGVIPQGVEWPKSQETPGFPAENSVSRDLSVSSDKNLDEQSESLDQE